MNEKNVEKAEFLNVLRWHEAGYVGNGVKVATFESEKSSHGVATADIIKQFSGNDEDVFFRPQPGRVVKNGIETEESVEKYREFCEGLVKEGINIVSMSLNQTYGPEIQKIQKEVLIDNGITLICAAGNNGERGINEASKLSHWISVGACELTKRDGVQRVHYSSIGEELDVCGFTNLYTTWDTFFNGTSCACPATVGIVRVWFQWFKEHNGRFPTPKETHDFMVSNTVDLEIEGHDKNTGYGLFRLPELGSLAVKENIEEFTDIISHWAKSIIIEASKVGLVKGNPDGTFKPDELVSRAEFTKMIMNLYKVVK